MHHTRGRLQDYNSILPNSKRSFFTSRSGVCREYPAWLKPMKNRQMCFLKTPFSPMPLLNLVIVDMQHASSHKNHKSREIHIFEKKLKMQRLEKNARLKCTAATEELVEFVQCAVCTSHSQGRFERITEYTTYI